MMLLREGKALILMEMAIGVVDNTIQITIA